MKGKKEYVPPSAKTIIAEAENGWLPVDKRMWDFGVADKVALYVACKGVGVRIVDGRYGQTEWDRLIPKPTAIYAEKGRISDTAWNTILSDWPYLSMGQLGNVQTCSNAPVCFDELEAMRADTWDRIRSVMEREGYIVGKARERLMTGRFDPPTGPSDNG